MQTGKMHDSVGRFRARRIGTSTSILKEFGYDYQQLAIGSCRTEVHFLMGKRREPRIQFDIPVKVCGMDTAGHPFVQSAYAISISRSGVRLTGVGPLVRVGETVVVIYKNRKARFKVVWIGEIGQPEAGQAGLEAADPNALIWDFPLPHPGVDGFVSPDALGGYAGQPTTFAPAPPPVVAAGIATAKTASTPGSERRTAPRYKCRGSADIFVPNVSFPTRGQIDDVSLSGVYIQTNAPLLVGSVVKLNLTVQGTVLQAEAEVRTSHPGVGMGLMFTNINTDNRLTLGSLLNRLGGVPAAAPKLGAAPARSAAVAPAPAPAPTLRYDAIGRAVAEWFQNHEFLSKEEFLDILRRQ